MILARLGPAIFGSEGQRSIHYARRPITSPRTRTCFLFGHRRWPTLLLLLMANPTLAKRKVTLRRKAPISDVNRQTNMIASRFRCVRVSGKRERGREGGREGDRLPSSWPDVRVNWLGALAYLAGWQNTPCGARTRDLWLIGPLLSPLS